MKYIVAFLLISALVGCGGSDGDSTSDTGSGTNTSGSISGGDTTTQEYSTAKLTSVEVGTIISGSVEGVLISNGTQSEITGTVSMVNRSPIVHNGVVVHPRELSLALVVGGVFEQIVYTNLYDASGNLVSATDSASASDCSSSISNGIPATIENGDFGTLSESTCTDGRRFQSTYSVVEGEGSDLMFLQFSREYNASGVQTRIVTAGFGISTTGQITEYGIQVQTSDGSNLTVGTL